MKTRPLPALRAVLLAAALAVGSSTPARAADSDAETLYQQGRRAAQSGDFATACAKFRTSYEREAAPGTLLNLADCEEKTGALRSAREHFEAAARSFKAGDERVGFARQRAADVERRTPRLTIRLSPHTARDAVVEQDGTPIPRELLGNPMALDPGPHTLLVRAPGHVDVRSTLRLATDEHRELELTSGVALAASEQQRVQVTFPPHEPAEHGHGMRTAGIVTLAAGGAGLALGFVGGVVTWRASRTVDEECNRAGCTEAGMEAQARGRAWSPVSTIAFIAGGAGVLVGTGLLLWSGKTSAVTMQPALGGTTLGFRGSF